jgi:hypothetical protein
MSHLRPCPGCDRHVRADVTLCPFCDAALAVDAGSPVLPAARLGRAAQMAFGAAAVAASLSVAGCTKNPAGDDSGNIVQPYGAPPDRTPTPMLDAATANANANEVDASAALAVAVVDAGHEAGTPDAGKTRPPPTATATTTTTVSPRDWGNHAKPYGAPPADGLGEVV